MRAARRAVGRIVQHPPSAPAAGGLLLALLAASACSPEVATPELPAEEQIACDALLAALPATLDEQQRRDVEPPDAPGAAYGDPAIIVSCGADAPPEFDEFAQCQEVDGVGWFIRDEDLSDAPIEVTVTAVGYRPRLAVVVPAEYWPMGAGTVMAQLAEPVSGSLELVDDCT